MENRCKFIFALTLVAVFLFYRVDTVVAMETVQNIAPEAEPEPEQIEEPAGEPEPEQIEEPAGEPEPEQIGEPAGEPEPEQIEEPAGEPEPEQIGEPAGEPEPEQIEELTGEPEPEQIEKPTVEPEPEIVSTGPALTEWLESHKNTGGTVKLADDVVLDGEYSFYPSGINSPDILVDTGQYTITVTGEIAFLSNGRLTFSGEPEGKGIFYVAEKGILSIYGISVESGQCALWQEEGAGLEISDSSVLGEIHYADTPFVMYYNDSLCAVVEKGQTVNEVLPTQIICTVNRQGQLYCDEPVAISWNLEGTEKQQEERQRFELQGSFLHAVSAEPALCAVVYNDYPLTFTDVKASVSGDRYTFQGGFTVPEEFLPFTIMAEYSFDGENWFTCEEQRITNTNTGFYIFCKPEQISRVSHFNIYIRLQWNNSGTRYFSNVLCYAADNLEHVDDIGGSRGGGTSIIDPPENPKPSIDEAASVNEEASQEDNCDTDSDKAKPAASPDDSHSENPNADAGQTDNAELSCIGQPLYAESSDANAEQSFYEESELRNQESLDDRDSEISPKREEAVAAVTVVYGENSAGAAQMYEQAPQSDSRQGSIILMASGFVLLSGIAGTAGFFVHSRSGTNR